MRTESLASSHSCHSVDTDAWCKRALTRSPMVCKSYKQASDILDYLAVLTSDILAEQKRAKKGNILLVFYNLFPQTAMTLYPAKN